MTRIKPRAIPADTRHTLNATISCTRSPNTLLRGGGENVLLSSASFAHAHILVAGCNRTFSTAPSLSSFLSIQSFADRFPRLACIASSRRDVYRRTLFPTSRHTSCLPAFSGSPQRPLARSPRLVGLSSANFAAAKNATAITSEEILISIPCEPNVSRSPSLFKRSTPLSSAPSPDNLYCTPHEEGEPAA